MAKKRYANVVEMMGDLTEDRDFARELDAQLSRRVLVTQLAALRAARGLTQAQVAEGMGQSQGQVSKIETGTDDRLSLGDLVNYAGAIGVNVEISLVGKDATAVDRVKHHAFSIKKLTDYLAGLAVADTTIAKGVSRFFSEAAFNVLHMLQDSAKKLPSRSEEPRPTLTVESYGIDDESDEFDVHGECESGTPERRREVLAR